MREYEVRTKDGQLIGLYRQAESLYQYTLQRNGIDVKKFQMLGDAYRAYNKLIANINKATA